MFEKLDELLNALEKDDVETPSFCREFVKVSLASRNEQMGRLMGGWKALNITLGRP